MKTFLQLATMTNTLIEITSNHVTLFFKAGEETRSFEAALLGDVSLEQTIENLSDLAVRSCQFKKAQPKPAA